MSTVHQFPVQRNQPPAAPEEVADALGVAIDAAVGASRHSLWLVWTSSAKYSSVAPLVRECQASHLVTTRSPSFSRITRSTSGPVI